MSVEYKYFKIFPQLQVKLYFKDYFAFVLLLIGSTSTNFECFLFETLHISINFDIDRNVIPLD